MAIPLTLNRLFEQGPYRRNLRALEQWSIEVVASLPGTKIEPLVLRHSWPAPDPQDPTKPPDPEYGPWRWNLWILQAFIANVCKQKGIPEIRLFRPFDALYYRRTINALLELANLV